VSAATLYNWRRAYGGMDTDAVKELRELREETKPGISMADSPELREARRRVKQRGVGNAYCTQPRAVSVADQSAGKGFNAPVSELAPEGITGGEVAGAQADWPPL
jgi:hypothetical protein